MAQRVSLSARAEALLQDMARDHGLRGLEFDKDGLIPIRIGGIQIAIAYSGANDSFFMMSVIDDRADGKVADPWRLFELCAGLAARRTRIAIEPKSGSLVLVGELFLAGIDYWQLAQAIESFVKDCREVMMAPAGGAGHGPSLPSFAPDEGFIRV
jgi:Tir chaperone protein (CesT) family